MGKKDTALVHLQATKSWWSGRVTSLCGQVWEPGTYDRKKSGPRCPVCFGRAGKR